MPTPPTPQERRQNLVNMLTQVSREQRASPAYYGNLLGVPGGIQFRRLISAVGFVADTRLTYVTPAATNLQVGSEPRTGVTTIKLRPYGYQLDVRRLSSTESVDRAFHGSRTRLGTGVVPFGPDPAYVMPGYCLASTTAEDKDVELVLDMTTPQRAKSWHFYVNRLGDLILGAAVDDVASAGEGSTATTIDIAYEALVVVSRDDHHARSVSESTLIEAPMTLLQLRTLGILSAKLETAFAHITENTTGFSRVASEGFRTGVFAETPLQDSPFDYATNTFDNFFTFVDGLPDFDLSTDIFRPASAVQNIDRREVARTAISDTDTLGIRSTILANYASISAGSRAQEMQDRPRVSYFLRRSQAATQAADTTAQAAAGVSDSDAGSDDGGGDTARTLTVPNTDAFIYNFRTGQWGDRNPV